MAPNSSAGPDFLVDFGGFEKSTKSLAIADVSRCTVAHLSCINHAPSVPFGGTTMLSVCHYILPCCCARKIKTLERRWETPIIANVSDFFPFHPLPHFVSAVFAAK